MERIKITWSELNQLQNSKLVKLDFTFQLKVNYVLMGLIYSSS